MHGARPLRSTRRLANLTSVLPKWYSIRNQADGPALVNIYDEIGFYGVSAASFMDDLHDVTGDIEMHINSPGGDVFEGITIYERLKARKGGGKVSVVIDGLAASAASFIAMAASPGELEMAPHSRMMIHDGFGMAIGNAKDMREMADLLEDASDNIASIYAERSGKTADYWRQKMLGETWFKAEQAVAEGLADRITGQDDGEQQPGDWDLSVYAAARKPRKGKKSRKPRYDPDHDGDDDSSAAGDTDHDYVQPDGSPGPKAPKRKKSGKKRQGGMAGDRAGLPIRAAAAEVDSSSWDGPAAMSAASKSDDPAAALRAICAGRRSGPADEEKSYALPHHKHPGAAPNADGVRNALSRLPQTHGLTNSEAARSHLEAHMRAINPDHKPGDEIDPALLMHAFGIGLEGAV